MNREISINQEWYFAKTAQLPKTLPTEWEQIQIPHTWNHKDGQDGGDDYWRGTAMYAKSFRCPDIQNKEHVILSFEGVAMSASIYLNGEEIGRHAGGFSAFRFDITKYLQEENLLCIAVDNGRNETVYPQKADFTFYGGIYRPVYLEIVSESFFDRLTDGGYGLKVMPIMEGTKAIVQLEAHCIGALSDSDEKTSVRFQINHLSAEVPVDEYGYARSEIVIEHAHLWDGLEDPFLYTVTAQLIQDQVCLDEAAVRFGCRTMEFDPEKGFLLNGKSYPLRGVSRHQDYFGIGNAITEAQMKEDMDLILEIGANTVRLAHYQHAQSFYDLCDENGIIVWAEIPYITKHMREGRNNTLSQMRELITQCAHHPCILCWGLSNEITASSEVNEDLMENHRMLQKLCHDMDPTRKTVMAHAFMLEQNSELIPVADLASYNLYFGWYMGELSQNGSFFDEYHQSYPDRCIGFSEYGADGNPNLHSDHPARGDYSEEFQCLYHEYLLQCIEERPYLWCSYVWNMFDFAADGRDEGGKSGQNQKGLVTMDRRIKKDAFYLYKAAWSKKPFIHLCGSRFVNRTGETAQIKVYSNQEQVTLIVDGEERETKTGSRIFHFTVPISGEHTITAASGDLHDQITICKVEEADPSYRLNEETEIINWFDKDELDPDAYSVRDSYGVLMADQRTNPIVSEVMNLMLESRGEVAKSAMQGEGLQKMLAGIPFESLMKQAGDTITAETANNLNCRLQKIKKTVL